MSKSLTHPSYKLVMGDDTAYPDLALIFLCDHASNYIPRQYNNLGLGKDTLSLHIAYDPGALLLCEGLNSYFGGSLLHSCFSRLLIDPNRGLDDPTSIVGISDNHLIRANFNLKEKERDKRIKNFYLPYDLAINSLIEKKRKEKKHLLLISIHSFTKLLNYEHRFMEAALLWDVAHSNSSLIFLDLWRHYSGNILISGNDPYSGEIEDGTLWRHCLNPFVPSLLMEYRQDRIADKAGQKFWLEVTIKALEDFISRQIYIT